MSEKSIAFDSVLDLCQNQHRRIILRALAEEQRSLTLEVLTDAILKYNHQTPLTETVEEVQAGINFSLIHVHLPKLTAEGLITYDPDKECVKSTERFDQMQPTLSTIIGADPVLETPMVA